MLASVSFLLAVLCNLAHNVSAQRILDPQNAVLNGEVVLHPADVSGEIKDVTWKHNSDIALDWFGDAVTSYREFKGRTSLDKTNGVLTIKNLISSLSGTYTAEINNKIVSSQQVNLYNRVPKPTLTRTDGEKNSHVFRCKYNVPENTQPMELKWKIDNVEQRGSEVRIVQGKENCSFVCELTNPVSKQSSDVVENPSCTENQGLTVGAIVGGFLIFVFVLLLLTGFYLIFVKTPHWLEDKPIIKNLQNSPYGKRVDGWVSTFKAGKQDDAAGQGGQDAATVEGEPMIPGSSTADSSPKPGANGQSNSKQVDETSAPEEDQN